MIVLILRILVSFYQYDFATSQNMTKCLLNFLRHEESGATAIEYALIASGIALAIVVAYNNYAQSVGNMYVNINNNIQ